MDNLNEGNKQNIKNEHLIRHAQDYTLESHELPYDLEPYDLTKETQINEFKKTVHYYMSFRY